MTSPLLSDLPSRTPALLQSPHLTPALGYYIHERDKYGNGKSLLKHRSINLLWKSVFAWCFVVGTIPSCIKPQSPEATAIHFCSSYPMLFFSQLWSQTLLCWNIHACLHSECVHKRQHKCNCLCNCKKNDRFGMSTKLWVVFSSWWCRGKDFFMMHINISSGFTRTSRFYRKW